MITTEIKGGRVLSKANEKRLRSASEAVALAAKELDDVLKQVAQAESVEDDGKAVTVEQLLANLMLRGDENALRKIHFQCDQYLKNIEGSKTAREHEDLLEALTF